MFSHVYVGVGDFDRAMRFYAPLMDALGNPLRFVDPVRPWAGWQPPGQGRPLFLIGAPVDGQAAAVGNGHMTAFAARDRACVRDAHRLALEHGGACDGPPGLRPEYHPDYYGAYIRDPDGNKLCFVCHDPETT